VTQDRLLAALILALTSATTGACLGLAQDAPDLGGRHTPAGPFAQVAAA
jgi:hypothetical protein